jgi:hypothetical protein
MAMMQAAFGAPEPSSVALMLFGGSLLMVRGRRRCILRNSNRGL